MKLALLIAILLFAQSANAQSFYGPGHPGAAYLGAVGTRAYVDQTQDLTNKQVMTRSAFFMRSDGTPQFVLSNFVANADGAENGNGGTSTIAPATETASIEFPPGTCHPLTFGGSGTATFGSGVAKIISDASIAMHAGDKGFLRQYYVGSLGGIYNNGGDGVPSLGDAGIIGTSVTDQTVSCGTVVDGGVAYRFPLAIVAQTAAPAICIIGDSISQANGGTNPNGDVGETAMTVGNYYGYINMAVTGTTANAYASGSTYRQTMYQYCSAMADGYGRNDFFIGRSVAQLETDQATIYAAFSGPVFQNTLVPDTTSTDSWATSTNQTASAYSANIATFNAALLAGTFKPNGGVFDVASAAGTGTNNGLWKSSGAGFTACQSLSQYTIDGVHPTTCGSEQIQASGIINISKLAR